MNTVGPAGVLLLPAGAPEAEWLEARQHGLGASEIAQVLGLSTWGSPYSVWARKTSPVEATERTERQRWGLDLEAVIASRFASEHPEFRVEPVGLVANRNLPWVLATPDRGLYRDELAALLELKTAGAELVHEWDDEPPHVYWLQCQWQMLATGLDTVFVAVLIGGSDYREYEIPRDEDAIAYLLKEGRAFWDRVENGDPPEVDGSDHTTTALNRRYYATSGAVIELSEQAQQIVADYWAAHNAAKAAEEAKTVAGNRLRAMLGDAVEGTIGGRSVVSWKPQSRVSFDSKRFREAHPDLWAQFSGPCDFRVLRPSKKAL